jgi:hypothetical protein
MGMGLFCVNFHFRTTDDRALADALSRRRITQYRIVPAKSGWISLYERQASEQDDRRIRELAGDLSKDLQVAIIAFLVHDSDIACYWLYDKGQLLDEYNSNPEYFGEADEPPGPSGGRPDILVRYCARDARPENLAAILAEENVQATTFAEDLIRQLAEPLGIDSNRALADYDRPAGDEGPGDNDRAEEDDDGPSGSPGRAGLRERLAERFGLSPRSAPADPRATALVQAAASGNINDLNRLLREGVGVEAEGPAPLPTSRFVSGLAQLVGGGALQLVMTPLLAAIINKQRPATELLLNAGANPQRGHKQLGSAVHAAVGAGDAELLQVLIDHGADVNVCDARGLTPLQILSATRTAIDRVAQKQATMQSLGRKFPAHLAKLSLPLEGWEACERLLKAHGAR